MFFYYYTPLSSFILLTIVSLFIICVKSSSSLTSKWPASLAEICVVPTTFPIRPHTTCADTGSSSTSCDAAAISMQGQIGETESIQLLLRKGIDLIDDPTGGLQNVNISIQTNNDQPIRTKPISSINIYKVGYVYANHSPRYAGSGGGWRPDPLLPLGEGNNADKLFDIPPSTSQGIWISFTISYNAKPGLYTGNISISCSNNKCGSITNKNTFIIPLSLTVWNITLPTLDESNIGTAWSGSWNQNTFEPYYGKNFEWEKNKFDWYDMMINHRMPPDSLYLHNPRPIDDYVYLAKKGVKWFGILDVQTLPLSSRISNFSSPVLSPKRLKGSCQNYTNEYVDRLIIKLKPIVDQLTKANILDRAYIYGFDENPVSCEPQVRKLFGATKKAFPNLRTAAVLNWSPMPVDLPVDIWILQYEEFNSTNSKEWVAAGKEQWQYHCIEPHDLGSLNTFIERPGIQNRLLFWLASLFNLKYGAPTGWLYYAVNLWRPCNDKKCGGPVTPIPLIVNKSSPYTSFPVSNYIWEPKYYDIFANGDGQYLYPCEGGKPCSSIRLSNIRDGLEDWELFSQLKKKSHHTSSLVKSNDDVEYGIGLIEEIVRGARDWENVGNRKLEIIRENIAKRLMGER